MDMETEELVGTLEEAKDALSESVGKLLLAREQLKDAWEIVQYDKESKDMVEYILREVEGIMERVGNIERYTRVVKGLAELEASVR